MSMTVTITSEKSMSNYEKLVEDLKELISGYVEEDQVSPTQFVCALRAALAECHEWHETRSVLLEDTLELLKTRKTVVTERELLLETTEDVAKVNYQAGFWPGND